MPARNPGFIVPPYRAVYARPGSAAARRPPRPAGAVPHTDISIAPHLRRGKGFARGLIADFLSIEAAFTWFLFAGWYKDLWELRWFPVDITLFVFAWTLLLIVVAAFTGRIKSFSFSAGSLLMVLFAMLAMLSLSWSSLEPANFDKTRRFLMLSATAFLVAQMIAEDRERRQRFGRMLLWFSSLFLLYYLYCRYLLGLSMEAGGEMGPDNYLEYGADARTVFVLCLTIASFGAPRLSFVVLPVAGFTLYLLLIMGGRGPLVEALLAIVLLLVVLRWRRAASLRRLGFCVLIAAAAAGMYLLAAPADPANGDPADSFRTLQRFQMQLDGQDTSSMDERRVGRALAVKMWLEEPAIGLGFGEFEVKDPYLKYPHNVPLEILSELGLVGGALFLGLVALAVRDCIFLVRQRSCDWIDCAIALLFLAELATHVTIQGYLADDRAFLAMMGLVIGSRVRPRLSARLGRPLPVLPRPARGAPMRARWQAVQ